MSCRKKYILLLNNLFALLFIFNIATAQQRITELFGSKTQHLQLLQPNIISNNTVDRYKIVCGNAVPIPIFGSTPLGIDLTVTYKWVQAPDTMPGTLWNDAPTPNNYSNYQPSNPGASHMFYRRIVYCQGSSDTSNACIVKKLPGSTDLSSNTINSPNQYVYFGQVPATFQGTIVTGGNGNPISYLWFKSLDASFTASSAALEGTFSNANLVFSEGADTSFFYNRFTYLLLPTLELACVSYSSNTVQVILLDSNSISAIDTIICSGNTPGLITGNTSNNFSYQWQTYNGTSWFPISGANSANFQPGVLTTTTPYRRIVIAGGNTFISNIITIHVNPTITNTVIFAPINNMGPVSVCQGQTISLGSNYVEATGGNGTYYYQWQHSIDNVNWAVSTGLNQGVLYTQFTTPAINDTIFFRRKVVSGGCENISNVIKINPIIINANAGHDTSICGNTNTMHATPVTGATQQWWTAPSWITIGSASSYNTNITSSSYVISQLYWHVKIGTCVDSALVTIIFFHPVDPPNAGTDITLNNLNSTPLSADPPPYGTGTWSVVSGGGNFVYSGDAHTTVNNVQVGENIYRWTVTNAPCPSLYDDIKVISSALNIPEGFSPNGDGVNDLFEILGVESYNKSEFIVYDRWGNRVYYKSNYDNSWNGLYSNNKPLPEDTYFYVLTLNEKESIKGYLTLKR